uniref:InsA C-terminal domain n=1 Tax=Siphoviridae sp. ctOyJ30 TaxID=2826317 RepID=A0A8S5NCQ2_9CAUD|nr:MAG TPA: InsA C-terminal domain [Siphoviridae sp. ctOyJ30]
MAKNYTPEIMETIKSMAYGMTDAEICENCGMDAAEVARIRTEYADDIERRKAALKEAGYCG